MNNDGRTPFIALRHTESNPQLKEAARARSIRVTNLPEDTQDGVLQQFFSQQGKVVKTFVNVPKKTATVEFESEAVSRFGLLVRWTHAWLTEYF